MAVAASAIRSPRARTLARAPAAVPLALGGLAAISVVLRTVRLGVGFWIDEGLSVGIADRPLSQIPGTLRLDGSPPLYYVLLHLWMRLIGSDSEGATHALSLLFAVGAVPVAWALVRPLYGPRAAWISAVCVALNPFLTSYAQETRMYALVVLLGIVTTCCFVGAFGLRLGRKWVVGFALGLVAMLYTHNWAMFAGAGLAAGWLVLVRLAEGEQRRGLVRDGLLAAAIVVVVFAPWIPTVLFQSAHTGAPWAEPPPLSALSQAPEHLVGGVGQWLLLLVAGSGLATMWQGRIRSWSPPGRAAFALAVAGAVTLVLPWLASQANPAWATRYLAAALAPLMLLGAIGLSRAGRLGLAALAVMSILWLGDNGPKEKSNAKDIAAALAPGLEPGDLIISTQPEQAPVLHYYLADLPGLQWATITGRLHDLGVTDWRDGAQRLRATSVGRDLLPLLATVRPGQKVVLVQPDIYNLKRWQAPWTSLVRERSTAWEQWMRNDPRFRVVNVNPETQFPEHPNALRATVLVRLASR